MEARRKTHLPQTKGCLKRDSDNSDDDFMTPPPKKFRSHKRKKEGDSKNIYETEHKITNKDKHASINIRNPPKLLVDELKRLKDA